LENGMEKVEEKKMQLELNCRIFIFECVGRFVTFFNKNSPLSFYCCVVLDCVGKLVNNFQKDHALVCQQLCAPPPVRNCH
jgi:hypothetical protein